MRARPERSKKGVESPVDGTFDAGERGERRRRALFKAVLETEIDHSFRGLFVSDAREMGSRCFYAPRNAGDRRDPD